MPPSKHELQPAKSKIPRSLIPTPKSFNKPTPPPTEIKPTIPTASPTDKKSPASLPTSRLRAPSTGNTPAPPRSRPLGPRVSSSGSNTQDRFINSSAKGRIASTPGYICKPSTNSPKPAAKSQLTPTKIPSPPANPSPKSYGQIRRDDAKGKSRIPTLTTLDTKRNSSAPVSKLPTSTPNKATLSEKSCEPLPNVKEYEAPELSPIEDSDIWLDESIYQAPKVTSSLDESAYVHIQPKKQRSWSKIATYATPWSIYPTFNYNTEYLAPHDPTELLDCRLQDRTTHTSTCDTNVTVYEDQNTDSNWFTFPLAPGDTPEESTSMQRNERISSPKKSWASIRIVSSEEPSIIMVQEPTSLDAEHGRATLSEINTNFSAATKSKDYLTEQVKLPPTISTHSPTLPDKQEAVATFRLDVEFLKPVISSSTFIPSTVQDFGFIPIPLDQPKFKVRVRSDPGIPKMRLKCKPVPYAYETMTNNTPGENSAPASSSPSDRNPKATIRPLPALPTTTAVVTYSAVTTATTTTTIPQLTEYMGEADGGNEVTTRSPGGRPGGIRDLREAFIAMDPTQTTTRSHSVKDAIAKTFAAISRKTKVKTIKRRW